MNAKRVYRLYSEDGLTVRTKTRKKLARRARVVTPKATRPNQKLSMDFMSAKLLDGRWFRVLTVIDQFTRECLALVADRALNGHKVALALSQIVAERGTAGINYGRQWQRICWSGDGSDGLINTVCGWSLFGREDQSKMAISNLSTDVYATSA